MVSRDYTKEVGIESGQKTVSKPLAVVVIIVLAACGWFAVSALVNAHPTEHRASVSTIVR